MAIRSDLVGKDLRTPQFLLELFYLSYSSSESKQKSEVRWINGMCWVINAELALLAMSWQQDKFYL